MFEKLNSENNNEEGKKVIKNVTEAYKAIIAGESIIIIVTIENIFMVGLAVKNIGAFIISEALMHSKNLQDLFLGIAYL